MLLLRARVVPRKESGSRPHVSRTTVGADS
jgi:hypothetical protein